MSKDPRKHMDSVSRPLMTAPSFFVSLCEVAAQKTGDQCVCRQKLPIRGSSLVEYPARLPLRKTSKCLSNLDFWEISELD